MPKLRRLTAPVHFHHAGQLLQNVGDDPRAVSFGATTVHIDLRKCRDIWPAAVVWCVCYALLVRHAGRGCNVTLPEESGIAAYLVSAGLPDMLSEAGVTVDGDAHSQATAAHTVLP